MGTGVRIVVHPPSADHGPVATAARRAMLWLHRVDAIFSTYRAGSEISRIDRGVLEPGDASAEVQEILGLCEELRACTGGWFDARASGHLDPSGVVKGWAVERASALLSSAGFDDHLVECGGDIRVRGRTPSGPWQVGIVHPARLDAYCALLSVSDAAVATSGTYERGWHVLDPHRGVPATALAAVTVVGPDLTTTDAYATAALAMGPEAPAWLSTLDGYDWLAVDAAGRGTSSPGWALCNVPVAA
jgi:thiamine biosynthesis lipoprotein